MNQLELDFGVAVFSDYDADGHLEIQTDSPGLGGKAGTIAAEAILPYGLLARPLDPEKDAQGTPGTGCGVLAVTHGDTRHVMPLGDPRIVPKLPKVRKGGSGLYGGSGEFFSFILIDGKDPDDEVASGSVSIATPYTKDGTKKSHIFSMLVRESGEEAIVLAHGEGHGLTVTGSGQRAVMLKNAKGNASISVDDKGNTLNGKTKVIGPLTVGDQGAAQGVVLSVLLITYLTALEAAMKAAATPIIAPIPIAAIAGALTTKLFKAM